MLNASKKIRQLGFYSNTKKILTENELENFVKKIDNMYELSKDSLDYSSNAPVLQNLYGRDDEIDRYLDKIINDNEIKHTFENILGKNYKIWEISTRYSLGFDKGLEMHSDGKGQMNFVMYLNDQIEPEGVTAIWPRSHLLYRLSDFTSWRNMSFIWKNFTKPLNAKKGDYFFFINKTWHGRLPKKNNKITKALFFGCYSEGSSYNPIEGSEKFFKKVSNSELKNRLSLDKGKIDNLNGKFTVAFEDHSVSNLPFAMKIEKFNIYNFFKSVDQLVLLFFLELILFIPYRIYRLRKIKFF